MGHSSRTEKKPYRRPVLKTWGSVAELTQVGQTTPGGDLLPTSASGREGGSVYPSGLD